MGTETLGVVPIRMSTSAREQLKKLAAARASTVSETARHLLECALAIEAGGRLEHTRPTARKRAEALAILAAATGDLRRLGALAAYSIKARRPLPAAENAERLAALEAVQKAARALL